MFSEFKRRNKVYVQGMVGGYCAGKEEQCSFSLFLPTFQTFRAE
jgi:hypothetical protein